MKAGPRKRRIAGVSAEPGLFANAEDLFAEDNHVLKRYPKGDRSVLHFFSHSTETPDREYE